MQSNNNNNSNMQGRTDFWLFGTPISHSVAPAIQNLCGLLLLSQPKEEALIDETPSLLFFDSLFDSAGLHTHRYKLFDTGDLEKSKFAEELRKPAFGGCAVCVPTSTPTLID